MFSESQLKDRYIGNVEGRGLYHGEADVMVCEGFRWQRRAESQRGHGGIHDEKHLGGSAFATGRRTGSRRQSLPRNRQRYQYSETGGAPLLGIDGVCIICHGSSNALTITNALKGTKIFEDKNINAQIVAELEDCRL